LGPFSHQSGESEREQHTMIKTKRTRAEQIAFNRIEAQVTQIHARRCNGWAINMFDISKVFAAGHAAAAAGEDIEAAVVAEAARLRVDTTPKRAAVGV